MELNLTWNNCSVLPSKRFWAAYYLLSPKNPPDHNVVFGWMNIYPLWKLVQPNKNWHMSMRKPSKTGYCYFSMLQQWFRFGFKKKNFVSVPIVTLRCFLDVTMVKHYCYYSFQGEEVWGYYECLNAWPITFAQFKTSLVKCQAPHHKTSKM